MGMVTLEALLLHFSSFWDLGTCAHVPDVFFKLLGLGFKLWLGMWDPVTARSWAGLVCLFLGCGKSLGPEWEMWTSVLTLHP